MTWIAYGIHAHSSLIHFYRPVVLWPDVDRLGVLHQEILPLLLLLAATDAHLVEENQNWE